jgi:hypothetical protein
VILYLRIFFSGYGTANRQLEKMAEHAYDKEDITIVLVLCLQDVLESIHHALQLLDAVGISSYITNIFLPCHPHSLDVFSIQAPPTVDSKELLW